MYPHFKVMCSIQGAFVALRPLFKYVVPTDMEQPFVTYPTIAACVDCSLFLQDIDNRYS